MSPSWSSKSNADRLHCFFPQEYVINVFAFVVVLPEEKSVSCAIEQHLQQILRWDF